jgi:hypothetical protein
MRAFLIALGVASTVLAQPAQAIVGIYSGAENQTSKEYTFVFPKGTSEEFRRSGRVYFLYELETHRSVEIRIDGKQYRVRAERTLVDVEFVRSQKNSIEIYSRVLSGVGQSVPPGGGTKLFHVTWQGSKAWSGADPVIDPKSGMPRAYPTSLSGRQDIVRKFTDIDIDLNFFTRRTATLSLSVPVTKECNAANENFDQALVRLKNRLNASGYTENSEPNHPLD